MPPRSRPSTTPATPQRTPSGMGWFMIIHGVPNVGKSTFAAAADRPYYLHDPQERGILRLIHHGEVDLDRRHVSEAKDWKHLLRLIDEFPDDRQTLVMDALTGFQQMGWQYIADRDYAGKMSKRGFFNYQAGPKRLARNEWPRDLLQRLTALTERGKDVLLVAHSITRTKKNPSGEDYDHQAPYLDEDLWQATCKDAQYVFFIGWQVKVDGSKANENIEPRIFIGPHPAYVTKSLPRIVTPSVPMGRNGHEAWQNVMEKIRR